MFVRNCYLVYWDGCILDTEVTGVTTEKQPLLYPQLSLCPSCLSGRPKAFIEMYFSSMPSKEVGLELSFYQVAESLAVTNFRRKGVLRNVSEDIGKNRCCFKIPSIHPETPLFCVRAIRKALWTAEMENMCLYAIFSSQTSSFFFR
nr:uncharacterized protein LOC110356877 isoform X2 [Columba livia]